MFGASKLILLAFGAGYTCSLYFILEQTRKIMFFIITFL